MATTRDLIAETKRHLLSGQREPMNKLAVAVDATTATFTFTYAAAVPPVGSYAQIDLELVYVWEAAGQSITVERGQLGSTAAPHAAGAVATTNPKFSDFAIVKAINDDLADLSSPINGLYAIRTVDLTATTNSSGYDLAGATNVLEILDIHMKHAGYPRDWSVITNFELSRNVSTADFPSGFALRLSEGTRAGQPIRVRYKAGFAPLTTLTDDVEAVSGLPATAHDLPPLGAAMRLVAPREIRRNFPETQGDTRRAGEVPSGAIQGSMRGIMAIRQARIVAEAARLAQQQPDRGFLPLQPIGW